LIDRWLFKQKVLINDTYFLYFENNVLVKRQKQGTMQHQNGGILFINEFISS
jgi:hypothetical protein